MMYRRIGRILMMQRTLSCRLLTTHRDGSITGQYAPVKNSAWLCIGHVPPHWGSYCSSCCRVSCRKLTRSVRQNLTDPYELSVEVEVEWNPKGLARDAASELEYRRLRKNCRAEEAAVAGFRVLGHILASKIVCALNQGDTGCIPAGIMITPGREGQTQGRSGYP